MRQDQFEALQARAEQLLDVFLGESDSTRWPGAGLEPAAMDKQTRGDRYWCKKDAVATLACVHRITTLIQAKRDRDTSGGEGGDGQGSGTTADSLLEAEIQAAEKEAARLMDQVVRKASKAEFDKRVHGKG